MTPLTLAERHRRFHERHGGTCETCGEPTTAKQKGQPSRFCAAHARQYDHAPCGGNGVAYQRGCRCPECTAANTRRAADYRRRRAAAAVTAVRP